MPTDTSIGLSQDTRDRLDDYRAAGHDSMEDVIDGLMEIVPPADDILDGDACSWDECDKRFVIPDAPEDRGGVIEWFSAEFEGDQIYGNAYFCSPEHAAAHAEKTEEMAAVYPDKLIVGGMNEMRFEITTDDMRLRHRDDGTKGVSIPAPIDIVGTDAHGHEFNYHYEPIYVENGGKIRQYGVISEILREETHTAITIDTDRHTAMAHHPDEEKREEHLASYTHWYEQDCPQCGSEIRVHEGMDAEVECSDCGSMIERDPVPEHEIPATVREYRDDYPD